jgi:hypothetical protein
VSEVVTGEVDVFLAERESALEVDRVEHARAGQLLRGVSEEDCFSECDLPRRTLCERYAGSLCLGVSRNLRRSYWFCPTRNLRLASI